MENGKLPIGATAATKCSHVERVFRHFDQNNDGKISPSELQNSVRTLGGELSAEEAATVVGCDGFLTFDDFTRLMEADAAQEDEEDEVLREAFSMYEENPGTSGSITAKSLKRMLSRLGESRTIGECKAMISMFDLNGDGVLSFDEFRSMMR